MRRKRPQDSFRYAGEGILHCFRTQRHMQFHFIMLVLVLLSGLLLALDARDMLILLFCISLVIASEMINTAVEAVVDLVTPNYHPLSNTGLWHGGVVSGHSAIGFFLAITIIFTSGNLFVDILALLMAVIIAQSRVEAGVHSVQEVVLGALVAIFLTSSVYWLMPRVRHRLMPKEPPARTAQQTYKDIDIATQT